MLASLHSVIIDYLYMENFIVRHLLLRSVITGRPSSMEDLAGYPERNFLGKIMSANY